MMAALMVTSRTTVILSAGGVGRVQWDSSVGESVGRFFFTCIESGLLFFS